MVIPFLWERVCANLLAARAAATELNHVGLAKALELTLLILAKEPTRFGAAALRRHARYCGNTKASLEEATAPSREASGFTTDVSGFEQW
jgi:hypothetical protein